MVDNIKYQQKSHLDALNSAFPVESSHLVLYEVSRNACLCHMQESLLSSPIHDMSSVIFYLQVNSTHQATRKTSEVLIKKELFWTFSTVNTHAHAQLIYCDTLTLKQINRLTRAAPIFLNKGQESRINSVHVLAK